MVRNVWRIVLGLFASLSTMIGAFGVEKDDNEYANHVRAIYNAYSRIESSYEVRRISELAGKTPSATSDPTTVPNPKFVLGGPAPGPMPIPQAEGFWGNPFYFRWLGRVDSAKIIASSKMSPTEADAEEVLLSNDIHSVRLRREPLGTYEPRSVNEDTQRQMDVMIERCELLGPALCWVSKEWPISQRISEGRLVIDSVGESFDNERGNVVIWSVTCPCLRDSEWDASTRTASSQASSATGGIEFLADRGWVVSRSWLIDSGTRIEARIAYDDATIPEIPVPKQVQIGNLIDSSAMRAAIQKQNPEDLKNAKEQDEYYVPDVFLPTRQIDRTGLSLPDQSSLTPYSVKEYGLPEDIGEGEMVTKNMDTVSSRTMWIYGVVLIVVLMLPVAFIYRRRQS